MNDYRVIKAKFEVFESSGTSRVDLKLNNGKEVALFIEADGSMRICATNPNNHAELINRMGNMVKIDYFGHPFED